MDDSGVLSIINQVTGQGRANTAALPAVLSTAAQSGTTPDQEAEWQRLARESNVPVGLIRNGAPVKLMQLQQQASDLPTTSPVTAQTLMNPDNAAVAHDDIGTLTRLEDLAKNGFGPNRNAPISTLQFGTPRDQAEANYFATEYRAKPFQAIQGGTGKLVTKLAFPVAGVVDAVNGDDYYKEFASQLYDTFSQIQKDSVPDPSQTFGGKLVRSLQELAPMIIPGMFSPTLGLAGMAEIVGQATNDKYDDLTARGVDPDTALAMAMKSGMAAYTMTKLPFVGTSLTNSLVRGATLNPAFGALDRGLEKAGLNYAGYTRQADDINLLDPETMAHDLALGLLFGAQYAIQSGRPVVGDSLMESLIPFYDQYQAGRRADALTEIGKVVQDSKVNNRAPDLVQQHLNDVAAEHAGIDNAYVPVDRWNELFQSAGLDPAAVADQVLSNPEAYHEANKTGSDIVIPFGEFTGKLSGLEQYGELVKDARLSLGDTSLREAEAHVQAVRDNAENGGGLIDTLKNMFARSQDAVKGNESYNKIYDDLVGQQLGIGTERSTAEHNAHLVANAFRVLGERVGVDPYELYSNYNLRLVRPMDTSVDQVLERLRAGDMPKQSGDHLALTRLKDRLDRAGIDLNSMDNQQVRDHLKGRQELWQSTDTNKSLLEPLIKSANEKNEHKSSKIGNVQDWLAKEARSNGINIDGYQHSIDTSAIRHILDRHGDVMSEGKEGLVAVTHEDIASIPEIIATPDKVVFGAKNKRNQDMIVYLKTMPDGSTLYIEEVRVGKKELATASMGKYPATSRAESILFTLDSTAKTDGRNNLRIVEAPENVKMPYQSRPIQERNETKRPTGLSGELAQEQGSIQSFTGRFDGFIPHPKASDVNALLQSAASHLAADGVKELYQSEKPLDTDALWAKLKAPLLPRSEARGAEPSKGDEPSTLYQTIPNTDDHVNIKIFDREDVSKKIKLPIVVTGKELGEHGDDISSLRKSAVKWYRDNLQGKTTANRKDLGEIRFTQVGRQEIKIYSANSDKLRLVPALKNLIENGEYIREENPSHPRKDGIVKFHIIESRVELAGKPLQVEIDIGEDARGNKFYDVFPDVREHETMKASKRVAASKIAGHPEALHGDVSTLKQSMAPSSGDVNIRILNAGSATKRGYIPLDGGSEENEKASKQLTVSTSGGALQGLQDDEGVTTLHQAIPNSDDHVNSKFLDTDQGEVTTSTTLPTSNDHVKKVVTGVLYSAITRIKTPADAAHIAFPLTKRAQEAAIAIVTDAKGNVLGVIQHSTGALDSTTMSPRDLLGVVHDFPGAAEVWFAHNHPTGDPAPSPDDMSITSRLATLLDGSGIKTRGMIVVGQEGGAVWTEGKGGRSKKIPLGSLNTDKERTQKIDTYDREIIKLPSSERFTTTKHVIDFARLFGAGDSGIIIIDGQAKPVSFVPMSVAEMARLKTGDSTSGSSAIMSAFHKGNGTSMIMVVPALPGSQAAARNMTSFGAMFGAPLSDVIEARNGLSFKNTGRMSEASDHFFQRGDAPVSHDFVPAPDGRYVFGEITPEIGAAIRRQSAPILLRNGNEQEGKIHIERPERLKQIQDAGYGSAEELVDSVVTGCDAIYQGQKGNLLLAKKNDKNSVLYIQLTPSEHGDYYDVKTAAIVRNNFFNNKKPLWERAQSNPTDNGSPMRDLSGQSSSLEYIFRQNSLNVKQGYIRFDTDRNFEIGLLKDANLSTFIHESGHFFTEILGDLAERPDAPRQIKNDYATLLRFAGVESRAHIRTEHHEKLARAFEAYIREGKAPSVEMHGLFQRMKVWMVGIYKDLTALHVQLNPEIREVFDRMLATDAEIERMRGMQDMKPLFATAADAGMSPAEFELYRKDAEQAGERAKEQLLRKLMAEKGREQKSWWQDEQAALRDEATAEAQEKPVYRALQEILKGRDFAGNATPGLKLDRAVLARRYGEEFLKRLPKGSARDYLYAGQGGAHPDLVAERCGFSSADEMIRAMMAAPPLGDFAAAETDARMKERHGDLLRDGRMAGEAMKAVHNDWWAEVLRSEIGALRGEGGGDADAAVPPVAAFRQAAREQIGTKQVKAIDPLLYLNGERKAAREAFDLYGKGDFRRAATARSRQLLNHFLYAEAAAALDDVDSIRAETGRMAASTGSLADGDVREVSQTAKRPIELTGKELGEYGDDIKSLRKAAIDWYRKYLQGKEPAHRYDLGEIKFTQVGRKEIEHFGSDPEKLKLVVALKDMIEKGDYIKEETPDHSRKDGIVKFHVIEVDVKLGDKPYRSKVLVGEDEFGNKFYDLFKDAFEHDDKKASKGTHASQSGGSLEGLQDSEGITTLQQIVAPSVDDVNIQIVPQTGAIRAETGRMAADTGREKLGPGVRPFREQMEALLSRFGLADTQPGDQPVRQAGLGQFLERLRRDEGIDLPIPVSILDVQRRVTSYRDLSMGELRSVSATLRMIEHAAGLVNTVRKGATRVTLGDAEQQLVERLNASIPVRGPGGEDDPTLSFLGRVTEHVPEIDIPIIRPEAQIECMDGHAACGPWHDFLWNPCNAAIQCQNRLRGSLFPAIFALTRGIDRGRGPIYIHGLRDSLPKDAIVAIALNCGNGRNLDLLLRGGIRLRHGDGAHALSRDTLQEVLGHLSADEIAVVNGVWKSIEALKPEVGAFVRRQTGVEPAFMETRPLEIANGTLEGGFYPVAFDPHYSGTMDNASDAKLPARMFLRNGDVGRVGEGGAEPLSLDLESVVVRHLDRIVTWITHGEFAAQAQRLLKRSNVRESIKDRLGEPAHKNLLDWVNSTLDQDTLGRDTSDWLENTRWALRARTSTCIVGLEAADVMADLVAAASEAMRRLEVVNVVRGSFEYLRDPVAVHRFAEKVSKHMRHLDQERERTMDATLDGLAGSDTVLDDVRRWVMESRMGAARVAAMMVWISGYREAQAKDMDGMEAVRYADKAHRMTLDAGQAGDLTVTECSSKARELAELIGPAILRYNSSVIATRPIAGKVAIGANSADGTNAFLFGIVATGILTECLKNRQPEADDPFLPWFLAHLALGLVDDIPYAGGVAGHGERKVMGEAPGRPVFEAGKATLHAVGVKGDQATITGHYLQDLLTGDYDPSSPWSPATDILNLGRHLQ